MNFSICVCFYTSRKDLRPPYAPKREDVAANMLKKMKRTQTSDPEETRSGISPFANPPISPPNPSPTFPNFSSALSSNIIHASNPPPANHPQLSLNQLPVFCTAPGLGFGLGFGLEFSLGGIVTVSLANKKNRTAGSIEMYCLVHPVPTDKKPGKSDESVGWCRDRA